MVGSELGRKPIKPGGFNRIELRFQRPRADDGRIIGQRPQVGHMIEFRGWHLLRGIPFFSAIVKRGGAAWKLESRS
jgi:hypothetical protein